MDILHSAMVFIGLFRSKRSPSSLSNDDDEYFALPHELKKKTPVLLSSTASKEDEYTGKKIDSSEARTRDLSRTTQLCEANVITNYTIEPDGTNRPQDRFDVSFYK